VYGKSSHSGMPELGENAIFHMNKFLSALDRYRQSLAGGGRALGSAIDPCMNVGVIAGGTGLLSVPDYCRIDFDRQVLPGEDMRAVIAEVEALFDRTRMEGGFRGKITCNQFFNSWRVDRDADCVKALRSAHAKVTGSPPEDMLFRAYCEVEMLSSAGIPGAVYGPGGILQAHRPDEFVPVQEVETAARTYALAALDFVS